jgi:hypothetical protein
MTSARSPELTALEARIASLVDEIRDAKARYAADKPRFDRTRREHPGVAEEETAAIRGIGRLRDDLQLARAELHYLEGKGPRPRAWVDSPDGAVPLSIRATLAEQSRADAGRLDYTEES